MSALYATINDCAAKNKPTGRGHRTIAATVKDWNFSLTVALAVPPKDTEMDTFADITIKDLRTGEEFVIDSDEMREMFKQAKVRARAFAHTPNDLCVCSNCERAREAAAR